MSIFHNGKEYGATKVINYSAAPDYNKGISITNIQDGNYQATDNGFLIITLQSQQSNVTKVSIVRSKTPIADNEGIEIASRVIQQFQYSETLTVQVMAREYYKLIIDGVGNPQIISCMFYPYASTVPMKLTENISVEQVEGLETAYVRDLYYNIIDDDSPITDIKDLPYGWSILYKELNNEPNVARPVYIPLVHKTKRVDLDGNYTDMYFAYFFDTYERINLAAQGIINDINKLIIWDYNVINFDLSISTAVSQTGTFSASQTILMIENDVVKKVPKGEIAELTSVDLATQTTGILPMSKGGMKTYTNTYGIWTEETIEDGKILLTGRGVYYIQGGLGEFVIVFPKRLNSNINYYFNASLYRAAIGIYILKYSENSNSSRVEGQFIGSSGYAPQGTQIKWFIQGILAQ